MRPARSATACVALAASCGSMAACGGSGHAASTTSEPVTKMDAVTYANAVNLQPADLGWEQHGSRGEWKIEAQQIAEARCAGGVSPLRWVAYVHSPEYGNSNGSMVSGVLVFPTSTLNTENARSDLTSRAFACYQAAQARRVGTYVPLGFHAHVSRLPAPLPGVPRSFAIRTKWVHALHVPAGWPPASESVYEDVLGFFSGPAEVSVWARSTGRPLPERTELQALAAMYRRAEARKL
jgi:hypothetical protein